MIWVFLISAIVFSIMVFVEVFCAGHVYEEIPRHMIKKKNT